MKQYQITITKGVGKNKTVTQKVSESPYDYDVSGAFKPIHQMAPHTLKEGEEVSADVNVSITIKCLVNRRAQRRAPDVIAAEKAAQAVKHQARLARDAEQQKRREKRVQDRQKRISAQIDHAFKSGSDFGSEPVSKFVTCENCEHQQHI